MNIHEYQAKKLLAKYGVPIPKGGIAHSATEAIYQANELIILSRWFRYSSAALEDRKEQAEIASWISIQFPQSCRYYVKAHYMANSLCL